MVRNDEVFLQERPKHQRHQRNSSNNDHHFQRGRDIVNNDQVFVQENRNPKRQKGNSSNNNVYNQNRAQNRPSSVRGYHIDTSYYGPASNLDEDKNQSFSERSGGNHQHHKIIDGIHRNENTSDIKKDESDKSSHQKKRKKANCLGKCLSHLRTGSGQDMCNIKKQLNSVEDLLQRKTALHLG